MEGTLLRARSFVAVNNTIGGLASNDSILYLPLNVAYGTSSTNCVWFQFDVELDPESVVGWYIWDIKGLGNIESLWPIGDYHYTPIGIPYTLGDGYNFSLKTSGTSTVTFRITDTTTKAAWSTSSWVWTVPSLNMLYNQSMFSPASAVEGYTTNSQLTGVPYFRSEVGYRITNFRYGTSGSGAPSGIVTYVSAGPSGYYYWSMYNGGLPSISISPTSVTMDVGQSRNFTASVTGGAPPYSYWWGYSNSGGIQALLYAEAHGPTYANTTATNTTWTFTPSSRHSYVVLCMVNDSVGGYAATYPNWSNVTVNAAPSVTISPTPVTMYVGYPQTFNSSVSNGTSPYNYQWYLNGNAVSGATGSTWTWTPTSAGSDSVYVVVTDNVGGTAQSNNASITVSSSSPPHGGGGGCVLGNTSILMPDGKTIPVCEIKLGDQIEGYDVNTGAFLTETVTSNNCTVVNEILSINNGLLYVTPTDQPIYTDHGWIKDPQDLEIGWRIYDPMSNSWITIQSLETLNGYFRVYDLRATSPDTFIGNGILLDRKSEE